MASAKTRVERPPPQVDEATASFLGPRGLAAVSSVPGIEERTRLLTALGIVTEALATVDRIELTPYELVEDETPSLVAWNALAPVVKDALVACHRAARRMLELFPDAPRANTVDFEIDAAFDAWGGFELPAPIRDNRDSEIDDIMAGADGARSFTGTIPAVSTLLSMLQSDIASFGERLRNPRVVADRWFLLGELHEMKTKCAQALEAVVASLLGPYTHDDLQLVLPRFAGAARRAVKLRTAMMDLSYDVERLDSAAQTDDVLSVEGVRHGLILRLKAFAELPAYRFLRPLDRREVNRCRVRLNRLELEEGTLRLFRQELEGFSKFLEVMRSINDREVLEARDRSALMTARMLLESEEHELAVQPILEEVYGRDRELDLLVRALRRREPIDGEVLLAKVKDVYTRCFESRWPR